MYRKFKMNIGVILDYERDWPPGIRAEKQSIALSEAGHNVFVFTPKYGDHLPDTEYIHRVKSTVCRGNVDKSKPSYFSTIKRAFTLFDERYLEAIKTFIAEYKIDILHVHDIWLIPVTQKAAEQYNIQVVADLHENMPAAMVAARSEMSGFKKFAHSILWNYRLMRWHEKRMLRKCIHTLIVTEEAKDRLLEYGLKADSFSVVSNTEDETTFDFNEESADQDILDKYEKNFTISYVGTIGAHRGLDTVLKAIPKCKDHIPDFKLVIVGADKVSMQKIQEIIDTYRINRWVDLYGWLPFDKVQSFIKASDVCLVPHNDFEHTQTTIPHKLFQYMICSKPVLVSDCKPLRRVVEDAECGRVFKASDPNSFADTLIKMHHNLDLFEIFGKNGKEAALGKYAWRNDANTLKELFSNLENKRKV